MCCEVRNLGEKLTIKQIGLLQQQTTIQIILTFAWHKYLLNLSYFGSRLQV